MLKMLTATGCALLALICATPASADVSFQATSTGSSGTTTPRDQVIYDLDAAVAEMAGAAGSGDTAKMYYVVVKGKTALLGAAKFLKPMQTAQTTWNKDSTWGSGQTSKQTNSGTDSKYTSLGSGGVEPGPGFNASLDQWKSFIDFLITEFDKVVQLWDPAKMQLLLTQRQQSLKNIRKYIFDGSYAKVAASGSNVKVSTGSSSGGTGSTGQSGSTSSGATPQKTSTPVPGTSMGRKTTPTPSIQSKYRKLARKATPSASTGTSAKISATPTSVSGVKPQVLQTPGSSQNSR